MLLLNDLQTKTIEAIKINKRATIHKHLAERSTHNKGCICIIIINQKETNRYNTTILEKLVLVIFLVSSILTRCHLACVLLAYLLFISTYKTHTNALLCMSIF